jgi:hypothetical protein
MAWTNGTFLRKHESKSDSHIGAKRNLGPKRGGKQGELAGTCTCSKCTPKGWLVVAANVGSHDPIRILYSCSLGLRFSQNPNVVSRTLISIPLVRFDCCDQGARLGKESCQIT